MAASRVVVVDEGGENRALSRPRLVLRYLRELRPVLTDATRARRAWIQDIGLIMEEARTGDPLTLSRQAGRLGHEQIVVFRQLRSRLNLLRVPLDCQACHDAVDSWLEQHIGACEALIQVETNRDLRRLRDCQQQLAEGRVYAQRFNEEYTRIVESLHELVGRRGKAGKSGLVARAEQLLHMRWPFGARRGSRRRASG